MNGDLPGHSSPVQRPAGILADNLDREAGPQPMRKESTMTWNTPKIVEIAVGLEINSYACAEV